MKNQPVYVSNGSENILACYGEKTIEGETYSKLIFFMNNEENCLSFTVNGNNKIDSVGNTDYPFSEADHTWRDVRRDVGSYATTKEELLEAVVGLVPDTI